MRIIPWVLDTSINDLPIVLEVAEDSEATDENEVVSSASY